MKPFRVLILIGVIALASSPLWVGTVSSIAIPSPLVAPVPEAVSSSMSSSCLTPSTQVLAQPFEPSDLLGRVVGNVVPVVANGEATPQGSLPSSTVLNLELVLKIQNPDSFQKCSASISDPTSPNYQHFLTRSSLQPYLPTQTERDSIVAYLRQEGIQVSDGASPLVLKLTATTAVIQSAFGVKLNLYSAGGTTFYAADSDPQFPENLASLVTGIMGLENSTRVRPATAPGSCNGPYCPQGIQVGYGFDTLIGGGFDGRGVTVGVVDEPGDPDPQTAINTFSAQYGLPAGIVTVYTPDGAVSSYDSGWGTETALDLDAVHQVAPGASIALLYCTIDVLNCVDYAAQTLGLKIISNSWTYCADFQCAKQSDYDYTSNFLNAVDSRLAVDALVGASVLFASGDSGSLPDGSGTQPGVEYPSSDPNVLAVGATNLILTGCGSNTCSGYGSETGGSISGGGYSSYFAEPSWQMSAGISDSSSKRAVPDVSMLGYSPGIWAYSSISNIGWFSVSGTSLSTPLWAGFLSQALQMRHGIAFGNIDPLIYQKASGPTYSTTFHDITIGSNNYHGNPSYAAGPGWDPVTGWGSPIVYNLANALTGGVSSTSSTSTSAVTSTHTTTFTSYSIMIKTTTQTSTQYTSTSTSTSYIVTYTTVSGSSLVGTTTSSSSKTTASTTTSQTSTSSSWSEPPCKRACNAPLNQFDSNPAVAITTSVTTLIPTTVWSTIITTVRAVTTTTTSSTQTSTLTAPTTSSTTIMSSTSQTTVSTSTKTPVCRKTCDSSATSLPSIFGFVGVLGVAVSVGGTTLTKRKRSTKR